MKRVLFIILAVIMVISAANVFAAEENSAIENIYDRELSAKDQLLTALDVFDKEHSEDEMSANVTRLEFAEYLAGLLGVKERTLTENVYFYDANEKYVNNLASMGIISGNGNGVFEEDRNITYGEAMIMSLRALGYEKYVQARGGGIANYIRAASDADLNFSDRVDEDVVLADVVGLLYDITDAYMQDVVSIRYDDGETYTKYTDKKITLLEFYRSQMIVKGRLTGSNITSIGETKEIARDQIAINDTVYRCDDMNAFSYIGQSIAGIYDKKTETILYVIPDFSEMSVFSLSAEEVLDYKDFKLTYQRSEDKREKNLSFEASEFQVIYNGKVITDDLEDAFRISLGTVTLYEFGNSGKYNLAVIEEYVDMRVKQYSTDTYMLYTDGAGELSTFSLENADDDGVYKRVYSNTSGLRLAPKSFIENDLISVCCSRDKEYIVIYVCTENITGSISSIYQFEGRRYIKIDEKAYPVSPYFPDIEMEINKTGKFFIDRFGYIGKVENFARASQGIAYLYDVANENSAFSVTAKVKLYTENKEHLIYKLGEKVLLDGEKISAKEAYERLISDKRYLKGLIQYTLNKDDEIIMLETGHGGDSCFSEMTDGPISLSIDVRNRTFGDNGQYAMTRGTKVFLVPNESASTETENFNVVNYREEMTPAFSTTEVVRIYQGNDDPFVEYVVCFFDGEKTNVSNPSWIHMMVKEKETLCDANGNMYTKINGYSNELPFEITVTDDVRVLAHAKAPLQGVDVIEPGDWIVCSTNAIGKVGYIMLMYNANANDIEGFPGVHGYWRSWGADTNAYYRDGDILRVEQLKEGDKQALIVIGEKETGEVKDCIVLDDSLKSFMIYDSSIKNGNFYKGKVSDIVSYEATNKTTCDRICYEVRSGENLVNMAVYK